jgi:CHAT domain-containing protein
VRTVLTAMNVDVVTMIGAPSAPRQADEGNIHAASRFDVLAELMKGEYDILHYAGHGTFDPDDPTRSGWLFDEGHLLSSHELEQVDVAPRLVVANACQSALLSAATSAGGAGAGDGRRDSDLLPALVDEFFRRGVRNYIGTAWNISDHGAVAFSEIFYRALLGPRTAEAKRDTETAGLVSRAADGTIGGALQTARLVMARRKAKYGALWAAYQHYGDPNASIINPTAPD